MPRLLSQPPATWIRPLRELKKLLYQSYLAAGAPTPEAIAEEIKADDGLKASPGRDTVARLLRGDATGSQPDTVAVATVLARWAAWNPDEFAARVRHLWIAACSATPPGRPIKDFSDRLVLRDLEVHPALTHHATHDRPLPAYTRRSHDASLRKVIDAAAAGQSGLAVLVGGSSTGKTRSCWEAARSLPDDWRLWPPPTHPSGLDTASAALDDVAPKTVIWLNEAHNYLAAPPFGERMAAGLRRLLCEPERAPVLVLATLWTEHWDTLITRTDPDTHFHARELLDGHMIEVPDAFTANNREALAAAADTDPRIREAWEQTSDGRITQYLAGVPFLLDRYRVASPAARALVHAAMDARRLGAGQHLPRAFLAEAAPGYLTDTERTGTGDTWLHSALEYLTAPCKGIPGILTPVAAVPDPNRRRAVAARDRVRGEPRLQLADYLDQQGRRSRAGDVPPVSFWNAAAAHARPEDRATLGDAARARGLYLDAAQLLKHATRQGDTTAAVRLVHQLHALRPTDHRPAHWTATHASVDAPYAAASLLEQLSKAGAHEAVGLLTGRAARDTSLSDPAAVSELLRVLVAAGAQEQTAILVGRATDVPLDDPGAVVWLMEGLQRAGARGEATRLAARAAAHADLGNGLAVAKLVENLRLSGDSESLAVLLARDPEKAVSPDDSTGIFWLLQTLRHAGAREQVSALAARAAHHADSWKPDAVMGLLRQLRYAHLDEQAADLAGRVAEGVELDDPRVVARLLAGLHEFGAHEEAATLLERDPGAEVLLTDSHSVGRLVSTLREVGADDQATALATRAVTEVPLDGPFRVASLLSELREAGAHEQVAVLLARDPAAHVDLGGAHSVGFLLREFQEAGAHEQVAALLARDPATQVDLSRADQVTGLVRDLQNIGAREQVTALLARDPASQVRTLDPDDAERLLKALAETGFPLQVSSFLRDATTYFVLSDAKLRARLLKEMRAAGEDDRVAALIDRLAATGRFEEFLSLVERPERFRFGREPDGRPAEPWGWEDLR